MIECERCHEKFDPGVEPGGIFIVPSITKNLFEKHHYCRWCSEVIAERNSR